MRKTLLFLATTILVLCWTFEAVADSPSQPANSRQTATLRIIFDGPMGLHLTKSDGGDEFGELWALLINGEMDTSSDKKIKLEHSHKLSPSLYFSSRNLANSAENDVPNVILEDPISMGREGPSMDSEISLRLVHAELESGGSFPETKVEPAPGCERCQGSATQEPVDSGYRKHQQKLGFGWTGSLRDLFGNDLTDDQEDWVKIDTSLIEESYSPSCSEEDCGLILARFRAARGSLSTGSFISGVDEESGDKGNSRFCIGSRGVCFGGKSGFNKVRTKNNILDVEMELPIIINGFKLNNRNELIWSLELMPASGEDEVVILVANTKAEDKDCSDDDCQIFEYSHNKKHDDGHEHRNPEEAFWAFIPYYNLMSNPIGLWELYDGSPPHPVCKAFCGHRRKCDQTCTPNRIP